MNKLILVITLFISFTAHAGKIVGVDKNQLDHFEIQLSENLFCQYFFWYGDKNDNKLNDDTIKKVHGRNGTVKIIPEQNLLPETDHVLVGLSCELDQSWLDGVKDKIIFPNDEATIPVKANSQFTAVMKDGSRFSVEANKRSLEFKQCRNGCRGTEACSDSYDLSFDMIQFQ